MKKIAEIEHTHRGFPFLSFRDAYDSPCSIQQSSLATEDALWIGIDDAEPKCMAAHANRLGVETSETTGWVKYPIDDDVLLTTRMHLKRDQVEAMVNHLQNWLDTGKLA